MNNYGPPPRITVQVDHIREALIHSLSVHEKEIDDAVRTSVDQALNEFDIVEIFRKEAGRLIQEFVARAIRSALYDCQRELVEVVVKALRKESWDLKRFTDTGYRF